ncbi:hypothetical protein ACFLRA_01655 [Bdellovibrionota bacterium]
MAKGTPSTSKKVCFLLCIILSTSFLFLFYFPTLKNPNSVLFSVIGDGIQNYHQFFYHANYDSMYLEFEGQNYPYSENVIFAETQPIFSSAIKFISENVINIAPYAIGIMNLAIILMLIPTALLLFLILCRFKLPPWYALFVSVGIALLSPQILRMYGHWGLSYTIFIPLAWYLLLLFNEKPSYWLSGLIMLNAVIWGFIHLYLVYILCVFAGFFWLGCYLKRRDRFKIPQMLPHFFIQVPLPAFILASFLLLTTEVSGRLEPVAAWPTNLWGVLFPHTSLFIKIFDADIEQTGYIGVVGLVVFLFSVWRVLKFIKLKKYHRINSLTSNTPLMISLVAAVGLFVFGMIDPLRFFPYVNNFRAAGRLAWVFFYVFTVFSFYTVFLLFRYLKIKENLWGARSLLISALCLLFIEATILNNKMSSATQNLRVELQDETLSLPTTEWIKHVDINRYQAIIPIPYFYITARLQTPALSKYIAIIASMKTGLPLTGSATPRAFREMWEKQREILDPKIKKKRIIEDYPNKKPFLILATYSGLLPEEEALLKKAIPLFENETMRALELPFDRISR